MANVSAQFMDDLGPLAAMWAGRDQGMQENTTLANQQNTLEQIANSQQTRDIQRQKLPFELSQLEHQQKMNPLLLEQQGTKNKSDLQKLNKDQFDNFFGQFKDVLPTLQGTPADAAVLGELAKKNGLDPQDPRIGKMISTATSGNPKAVQDMMNKIALMSEKSIQERTKQADVDTAHMERTKLEQKSAGERNAATIAGNLERAKIAAKARTDALKDKADIYALTKGDPVKMHAMLVMKAREAQQSGDTEKASALYEMANDPTLLASVQNQQAQRAQTVITPEGGIGTQGGTVPIPRAGPSAGPKPVNPAAASAPSSMPPGHEQQPAGATAAFADAEKERRYQEWKKSQGL